MGEYEIPLVIFTVFSQWAVGIIIASVLLEWIKPRYMNAEGKQVLKISIFIAFGLSVFAALASMLHLNNSLKGYTGLFEFGRSMLRGEKVGGILFTTDLIGLTS